MSAFDDIPPVSEDSLGLEQAAKLAGRTVRTLRKYGREGRLNLRGKRGQERVAVSDLVAAGLVAAEDLTTVEPSQTMTSRSTAMVPAADSSELLQRLLHEREQAASSWKERTESLYRELIDDQRDRLERLEEENRGLTAQLHDALRKIPRLLELETVEASAKDTEAELSRKASRLAEAEDELRELRARLARTEDDLERTQARAGQDAEALKQLRSRGLWDRVTGREPGPPGEAGS